MDPPSTSEVLLAYGVGAATLALAVYLFAERYAYQLAGAALAGTALYYALGRTSSVVGIQGRRIAGRLMVQGAEVRQRLFELDPSRIVLLSIVANGSVLYLRPGATGALGLLCAAAAIAHLRPDCRA